MKHDKEYNLAFLKELNNLINLYRSTTTKMSKKTSDLSNSVNVMCDRVDKIEEKVDDKK